MRAFATGSRVYGTPKVDSDIDLVIYVDKKTEKLLRKYCDHNKPSDKSIRFGRLNLILVNKMSQWDAWFLGTARLKKLSPVTRDQAIAEFTKLGIKRWRKDGESS